VLTKVSTGFLFWAICQAASIIYLALFEKNKERSGIMFTNVNQDQYIGNLPYFMP